MPASPQLIKQLEQDIEQRLGLIPAMYRSTPETFAAVSSLWSIARAGWLENGLPGVFKQRLVVYLALLSGGRYCLARHVAWLAGSGRLLDANAAATPTQLLELLQSPPPGDDEQKNALELLDAGVATHGELPEPGTQLEQALFLIAGSLFLGKGEASALRRSMTQAIGQMRVEQILLLISWFQLERQWTLAHPELPVDEDTAALLKREPELAQLLDSGLGNIENRERQRDKFMGMLGHELRNPVAAIAAVSDMFQVVGIEDERLRNASSILHRQTRSLAEMLDNLLDVSNLAFGRVAMAKVPLVPDEVLASVLRQQQPYFSEQRQTVAHTPAERRVYVMADRARLVQVFEHILSNLRKFARSPGSVKMITRVEPKFVSIRFHDDDNDFGLGHAGTMLEADGQVREARQQTSGFGIGLTVARMITVLHDGTLEAASAGPGNGATFTLRLPLASQDAGSSRAEKKPAGRPTSRMRVLAIEDNKDFAQLFRHMLEIMGCELDITSDARSGLKLAHERMPELIFCDIGLPGDMNGFDFARAVRADAVLAHIPLVAVSGYTSAEDREKAMAAGFDRVCAKPVKFADISEALSVYSAHRKASG